MLKALLSNKEKLQELANTPLDENCSAVILKTLPEKLGDPGKFLILCGFSELKCKALADLEMSSFRLASELAKLANLINIFNVSSEDFLEFDIESDLKEIEFLFYQDKDSSLKDSIDQKGLVNLDAIFADPIPEMFTDEHTLDYSSPLKFNVYDDDFLEVKSDAENVYDDPFDSKGEKIKESKLLIDELDLSCDFLHLFEYDSFISQDFSRVDALPSTNNEDK
nr:reverse transcriptase domain-containing protein [Tanacetum cinerariifolium]